MNPSTELNTPVETVTFSQNTLARWHKTASSTLHTPESGLNTLADCSAAVFEHLHALAQTPFSSETKKTIEAYLESLQKKYQHLEYSQDISLAAHYAVCATIDDMLRCMGNDGHFLQHFHNSRLEQEKFYSILNHISAKADKYIELLELMYLCLRFGYKGQYRSTPFGLQQWSLLTDNTYHLITRVRGQRSNILSPDLLISTHSKALPSTVATPKTKKKNHRFYLISILIFIFFAIAAGFIFRETYNATRDALTIHQTPTPEITT